MLDTACKQNWWQKVIIAVENKNLSNQQEYSLCWTMSISMDKKWNLLRFIFVRRYPDLGGFFLWTAGKCRIAALRDHRI